MASDKPCLYPLNGRWRCMGPMTDAGYRSFPWGYGATPAEAYAAWKKLQKRTAGTPEIMTAFGAPFLIPDALLHAPSDTPTMESAPPPAPPL